MDDRLFEETERDLGGREGVLRPVEATLPPPPPEIQRSPSWMAGDKRVLGEVVLGIMSLK